MNKENARGYLPFVQALADGKTIQHFKHTNEWEDIDNVNFSGDANRYRIKPELKDGWYRVAILIQQDGCSSVGIADTESREKMFERESYFVRWLTDRIEYKVEETT